MIKELRKGILGKFTILFSMLLIPIGMQAQNAIVGTGFSSGWGGGSCPTGNTNFTYLSEIINGTYGVTITPLSTGDRYWRFGIDWGGTTAHRTITLGSDVTVSPGTTYTLNSTCTTSGALRYNVPSTSYRYIFKTANAGTNPSGQFVFFEVQGTVRSVSTVAQSPATNVLAGQASTITATLSGALSTGQAVYLRYTNNNFASSTVVQMSGGGTTYSAQIPGATNTLGSTVRYYVFTSGTSNVASNGSNADLYTINLNNNAGSNYSYVPVQAPTFGSIAALGSACDGGQSLFTVTGLRPSSTSTIQYNINGGSTQNGSVAANGSGDGIMSIPAVLANDGHTLTVTGVVWNSLTINPSTNNTAVVDVTPNGAVGGSTSGAASVCAGTNSGTITLSGETGTIIRWESSTDNFATSPIIISNTTNTLNWSNLSATRYYRAVVGDGSCPPVNSSVTTITVSSAPTGGTLSGGTTVCAGSNAGTLTLSGHSGPILRWESSLDNFATAPTTIVNTSTTYDYENVAATTYYRVVVGTEGCNSNSSVTTVSLGAATTWNGTSWDNGAPDSGMSAIFSGDYNEEADISACGIVVNNNAVVEIPSGYTVDVAGTITVQSGSFTLASNANLFQPTGVVNASPITVKRNSSALMRQDYTLWSSPVEGQGLLAFSPLTVISPTVRFYTYNAETNFYNSVSGINSAEFQTGRGYLIRVPNNHPIDTPTIWEGSFTGIPNNGPYSVTMDNFGFGQSFNLVGNPYPSPIDMNMFIADNYFAITGTLYFWRKTNNAASPSYCSWTAGTFLSNGEAEVYDPLDVIQVGQGFFVEANIGETELLFTNDQRIDNHANQFFRQTTVEKHRLWLNLTNQTGHFSQTAIVYAEGGNSEGIDPFDGRYINDGAIRLNSLIESVEYAVQGRAPFVPTDVVPLTYTANVAGNFTITLDHVDGLFLGNQNIYLKDNLLGLTHDIKAGAYSFATEAGTFASRFEVVYENSLAVAQPVLTNDSVVIYKSDSQFVVDAGTSVMNSVKAFDMRGRLVAQKNSVNATQTMLDCGNSNQVLIVQITGIDGTIVNKKVVN